MQQSLLQARLRRVLCIFGASLMAASFTACVKQTRRSGAAGHQIATLQTASLSSAVNLNTATREELEKLPHIGPALASRIIEHRERYGRFRRPEHLLMVQGLSDRRFRELRSLIVAE